ncbi:exonuclease domain-containing protein [Spongiimicrobium salis]|uniref:exonuclease domain-containing protein n=1 Tax=Spongiimicrobium salis TaxID=1667022 RepID=UPI00374C8E92
MYCIVDIETTGNGIKGNKITEISIFKFDGERIVDEFTSLVNPECEIPYFITGLTGIDNALVRDAPVLSEISDQLLEIMKDCIFVAHSVNFDYNVIQNEFKNLGINFVKKKLCTVRLSRKLIPGYRSYSLGKLCSALGIPLTDRHRARGDAHATVLLFQQLLNVEGAPAVFKSFLNARSQEATLPPSLSREVYDSLPQKAGIYYFKDKKGEIIYIGKAKNIKKRVLSHFYDKSNKEILMCQDTATIDFELSGSELLALLMESAAIKGHFPKYNRAQKRKLPQYGIFTYEDRNGIQHLAFNTLKLVPKPLLHFHRLSDCRLYLEQICKSFQLCPKYCHLQEQVPHCSHYAINSCEGVCRGTEAPASYNQKVREAIQEITPSQNNIVIREKGRTPHEDSIVLLKDASYVGYGFIEKEMDISSFADIEAHIIRQKNTIETESILRSYIQKHPQNAYTMDYKTIVP